MLGAGKVAVKNSELVERLISEIKTCEISYSQVEVGKIVSRRCKVYPPSTGYEIFPLFDATGNMIALGVAYKSKGAHKREISQFNAIPPTP